MSVVGARPNFMKVAPIIKEIKEHNQKARHSCLKIRYVLVHTGQHYDDAMSDSFFRDLKLPKPGFYLGVGSASHAVQTSEIMKKFEMVLSQEKPDILIVVGDVNSTVACALVASKISYGSNGARPLIAHVEAGLRSFDRNMPEETNRVLTDHISDFLFVTEPSGVKNLLKEGISREKIYFVGNTMIDTLLAFRKKAEESKILDRLGLIVTPNPIPETRNRILVSRPSHLLPDSSGSAHRRLRFAHRSSAFAPRASCLVPESEILPYALLTLHRPSNVDNRKAFLNIIQALRKISEYLSIIFPCHPRTRSTIKDFGFERYFDFIDSPKACMADKKVKKERGKKLIRLTEPMGYLDFLCLLSHAKLVLTDSGGIQEETTCLCIPCITIRENTERPITIKEGTNILAGTSKEDIINAFYLHKRRKKGVQFPRLWDGRASQRIVEILGKMSGHN